MKKREFGADFFFWIAFPWRLPLNYWLLGYLSFKKRWEISITLKHKVA